MHQTAQRNPLASTTLSRAANEREPFKSGENRPVPTASVAVRAEAIQSKRLSGHPSKNLQTRCMSAKPYPYQPDHQVELLHLQAEADALILQLQTAGQKQAVSSQAL